MRGVGPESARTDPLVESLDRPPQHGVVPVHEDRTLEERRFFRHARDEVVVGQVGGNGVRLRLARSKSVPRGDPESGEYAPDLVGVERIVAVLAVLELDRALLQEGDRLPAGASGAGADQLHGVEVWTGCRTVGRWGEGSAVRGPRPPRSVPATAPTGRTSFGGGSPPNPLTRPPAWRTGRSPARRAGGSPPAP